MSGGLAAEVVRRSARRTGFDETQLERQGLKFDSGAPVTAAVSVGTGVAASFGDGVVRFFNPGEPPIAIEAHRGAVLCIAAEGVSGSVLTGGDDGRFLRVSPDGSIKEIATFGTRWVDCVATASGHFACSSGSVALVWRVDDTNAETFEHPSTVGGLAFDAKARRLAVAHYGGAVVRERGKRYWKSSKFVWHGSHGAVTFSPDGKFLVTAMQENALHGWRVRNKADMDMSGYPSKVKSFAWIGSTPFLATSGDNQAICWPFDGNGPMGRAPATCAYASKQLCTAVAGLDGHETVLAGFADGSVLTGRPADEYELENLVVKGSSGSAVSALALNSEGWLFVGEDGGRVLWMQIGKKQE